MDFGIALARRRSRITKDNFTQFSGVVHDLGHQEWSSLLGLSRYFNYTYSFSDVCGIGEPFDFDIL
jgi:hypothetical protein